MIHRPTRRAFGVGAVSLGLAAASDPAHATPSDAMSIGSATARIQLAEYASATCPHCAHFHETNWATLKSNYIDTGRVRLTLHEMLTPPPAVAFGMFQLARCNGADGPEYFRRLGILFQRQRTILGTGTIAGVVESLVSLGAEWGLTEAQVMASLNDTAGSERIMRSIQGADALGITGTPVFMIDGQRQSGDFQTPAGMTRALDAALAR